MACHRCSAEFKDPARAAQCSVCSCRYHTHDCGKRIEISGTDSSRSSECPKCSRLCYCVGGPVACHTGRTKRKREDAAAARAAEAAVLSLAGPLVLPLAAAPSPAAPLHPPADARTPIRPHAYQPARPPASRPHALGPSTDLAQALQNAAAKALTACAPAALGGAANPQVVTAANAAAAAFAVILMPCFATPALPLLHSDPDWYETAVHQAHASGAMPLAAVLEASGGEAQHQSQSLYVHSSLAAQQAAPHGAEM